MLRLLAVVAVFVLVHGCATDEPKKVEDPVVADQQPPEPPQGLGDEPTSMPEMPAEPVSLSQLTSYFAFDDSSLTAESQSNLDQVHNYMLNNSGVGVNIEGHCDERGTAEYNLALGQRRAESAKTYLIQLGIDGGRLQTVSYGEERPAADGQDESAWSLNRRVEFVVKE